MRRIAAAVGLAVCMVVLPGQASADDPAFSVADASGAEGGSVSFAVTFNEAVPAEGYTLSYSVVHGTTSDGDFAGGTTGTVSVTAENPNATISIPTASDTVYEGNEGFSLNVSKDGTLTNSATGTITDDDPAPTLALSGPSSVDEAAGTATYTVTLTGESATGVSVNYGTSNGTAGSGADYTATSGPLSWGAGTSGAKTFTVPIADDNRDEPDENFSVGLSGESGAGVSNRTVTTTINDNDATPTLVLTGPATVNENAGTVTYSIAISGQSNATVSVDFATAPGSAGTSDYGSVGTSRAWAPGDTGTKTVTVPIVNDQLDEADENFTANLGNPSGASITTGQVTTTIVDDDPLPSATINDVAVTEGNDPTTVNAVFTVTLSAASGRAVSIPWSTAPGTATEPDDYQPGSGTAVFDAGATTATITVVVKGDNVFEENEQFSVVLVNPTNATLADNRGQGTITNDDAAGAPTIAPASVNEGNAGATDLVFQVTLPSPRPQTTFNYRTVAGSATSSDFTEVGGAQLTFPASSATTPTTLPVTIKVNGDTRDENNETLTLQLLNPSTGAVVASAVGTIVNDDNNSKLSINDSSVDEPTEGTATLKFTITLAPVSDRAVSVDWATANGTASAGSDYTAASGSASFAPGETTKEITVSVSGDTVNEDNETVLVNLAGAVGVPAANVVDAQGVGTVIDKNAPPSLSIDDVLTREGELVTFTITLAGTTLRTVTVVARTVDGTAKDGSEYYARRSVLTFAPGEKSKTFQVPGIDDTVSEGIETYFVDLEDAVNATITKRRGTATIDVSDRAATVTPANNGSNGPKTPAAPKKVLLPRMVLGPRAVTISPTGVARMVVTCAKASPIACTGVVALESTTKPKFQLGRKTFSVQKGKKAFVRIPLSVRSLKLLKKTGLLQAKAVVVVKNSVKKNLRVEPGVVTLKISKPVLTKLLAQLLKPKAADDTKVVVDP